MPKRSDPPAPNTVFGRNLLKVIELEAKRLREPFSVNAWAKRHGFVQTTIDRILKAQDPSTKMLAAIAAKAGLQPWHMLIEDLDPQNPPVMYGAEQKQFIDRLKRKIGPEILDDGNTRPGSFDELADRVASDADAKGDVGKRGVR